eukprot:TRINITY_DN3078_c0_g1_i8.p1 TRINITY_DN3078_c0_g1~~TRINITY_DN3078_c0_g1_i8.p1  ORF type:complete len:422 (-),score=67.44 TRINITY_DN3078_c0_g1_i8:679-1944(-)
MSLCEFRVKKPLGKGGYGAVYQVMRMVDGKEYALKVLNFTKMKPEERTRSLNEIRFLASISHPCVIAYYEAFFENNKLFLAMEYASRGDLHQIIKKRKQKGNPRYFSEDAVWSVLIQIALGLRCLHHLNIIHRDIKSSNILISENRLVKICDLGVARLVDSGFAKTMIGTPYFQSPEIWEHSPYTCKTDVWSLGCVVYEMAALRYPYNAKDYNELGKVVLHGSHLPIPDRYSKDLSQVIERLIDSSPDKRPSIDQLLELDQVQSRMHLVPKSAQVDYGCTFLEDSIELPENIGLIDASMFPRRPYPTDQSQIDLENTVQHKGEQYTTSSHCLEELDEPETFEERKKRQSYGKEHHHVPQSWRTPSTKRYADVTKIKGGTSLSFPSIQVGFQGSKDLMDEMSQQIVGVGQGKYALALSFLLK